VSKKGFSIFNFETVLKYSLTDIVAQRLEKQGRGDSGFVKIKE